ncbi:MAG: peptide deformylase [Thermoflexibacter sp.]|jgi:peptide deformylase|nr:peptide deformylase [Thermoflexibacter sp.]
MIYPIVAYGDPVLRKVAQDIDKEGTTDIKKLVDDMFETMHAANGIGLAAPQIGMNLRLFVIDGSETEDEEIKNFKQVFINAQILNEEGDKWAFEEGCLSIPSIREDVMRPSKLRIRYYDADWNLHEEEYSGMMARVIQHEYDHIQGVLFIDYLSGLRKRLLKGKLNNISKGDVKVDYRMKFPIKK